MKILEQRFLNKVAKLDFPILITGETGTGKTSLAKYLHGLRDKFLPFVTINLASINESLIDSELFGHVRGSFTGATHDKKGLLDNVQHGTLFLDEVAELNLGTQKKLLELLEEKIYRPVGSIHDKKFKGKIIAATHQNLRKKIKQKNFRADLYYRLNTLSIELESLRSDKEKLEIKIYALFNKIKEKYQKSDVFLSKELLDYFLSYPWHGNYRELKNCMEYLISVFDGLLYQSHLPHYMLQEESERVIFDTYEETICTFEKKYLEKMLVENQGKINQTARNLEMSKTTLLNKIKKYNLREKIVKIKELNITNSMK